MTRGMPRDGNDRTGSVYARFLKPSFDRVAGLIVVIITLPVVLVLAAASWIAFGWPPIQRTAYVGRSDTRFNLHRINSSAEWGTDLRGRRRRLSTWLQRMGLDKLPHVWSVALGHMSLVGPRPLHPSEAAELGPLAEFRYAVKPGLTGSWRVHETDGSNPLERDREYLQILSLRADLGILVRTPLTLLQDREAA